MYPNGPSPDTRGPGRMGSYTPDQQGIRINCTGLHEDNSRGLTKDAVWDIPRYVDPTATAAIPRIMKGEMIFTHPSFTRRTGEGDNTMRPATAALNGIFSRKGKTVIESLIAIDEQIRILGLCERPYMPDSGDKNGYTAVVSGAHPVVWNHKGSVFNTGDTVYWSLPDPNGNKTDQSDGDPLNDGGRAVLLFLSRDQFLKSRVYKAQEQRVNMQNYRQKVQDDMFQVIGNLTFVASAFIDRVLQRLNAVDSSLPAHCGDPGFVAHLFGAQKDVKLSDAAVDALKKGPLKDDETLLGFSESLTLGRALLYALSARGAFSAMFSRSEMRLMIEHMPAMGHSLEHQSPNSALSHAYMELWRFEARHVLGRVMLGGSHQTPGSILLS